MGYKLQKTEIKFDITYARGFNDYMSSLYETESEAVEFAKDILAEGEVTLMILREYEVKTFEFRGKTKEEVKRISGKDLVFQAEIVSDLVK